MSLPSSSSTMEIAIALLHKLAASASDNGEACSEALYQAADYLQDLLDCSSDLGGAEAAEDASVELEVLMAGLSRMLPSQSQHLRR